ncbi:TPA: phage portal protein [Enterobacter hormaechei subsp. xiangfangensis]|nr:phage portal protein [Enterobacter hormaechei subsp. xiangfangensis]HAV1890610.1 phage portal protein [Enterobacter hormaechei subsp. xiangfangensis]
MSDPAVVPEAKESAIARLLRKILPGAPKSERMNLNGVPLAGSNAVIQRTGLNYYNGDPRNQEAALTATGDDIPVNAMLPEERLQRYIELEKMARSPTISAMLAIHISNALSVDKKSGRSFNIVPKEPSDTGTQKLCDELMNDLGQMLHDGLPSWALIMTIFGISYVRPHCEPGIGIVSFESSFYTLPHFIQEFVRGAQPAGYTGDYLLDPDNKQRVMAMPWDLIPMRVPFFVPSRNVMPTGYGYTAYSLLTPLEKAPLVETQDYGTSFLINCYEPWLNLMDALRALKATRNNAAKIDRLIAVAMGQTDPANGARYINQLGQHLKRNQEAIASRAHNGNTQPSVLNHFIPVNGDGKGSITIDTQQTPSDITGIEDVMFHLRQLCAAGGIDATLLGWADQMAGGLGEGGWLSTAIQAAQRAEWIRMATEYFILRAIDIHLAWKTNKVYPADDRPYRVEFNSLNTAIAERELAEQDGRANFISVIVTILDQIVQNPKLEHSSTLMTYLFGNQMKMPQDTIDKMFKEFAAAPKPESDNGGGGGGGFMESAEDGLNPDNMSRDELIELVKHALEI